MANVRRWSSSASGNASVAGGTNTINFAEGQTPGSVNNSAREVMAQIRTVYTPDEWGWVEYSQTASIASQTVFKLSGNQTPQWTAGRRWRLKSGSTTRYGAVVSSSYTSETTITVTVDSGSLSASHSLAALAAIDSNHIPANSYVTSASLATALGTYITSASVATALSPYITSASVGTAIANFVTSNSASTMIATQIAASPSGAMVLLGSQTISGVTQVTFSGSWSAYAILELFVTTRYETIHSQTPRVSIYTDGGTTALLTTTPFFTSATMSAATELYAATRITGVDNRLAKTISHEMFKESGALLTYGNSAASAGFINAIKFFHLTATSATMTNGVAFLYGYKNA